MESRISQRYKSGSQVITIDEDKKDSQIDSTRNHFKRAGKQDPVMVKHEELAVNELVDTERSRQNLLARLKGSHEFNSNRRKVQIKTQKDLDD
jgi:hypothetical protein